MKKCPYEENKRCTRDCKYAMTCIKKNGHGTKVDSGKRETAE